MKLLKKMTPLMLATMMIAPTILINQAYAQGRGSRDGSDEQSREENNRDGGQGESNSNQSGELVQIEEFRNWNRQYIGKLSIKLEKDSIIKKATDEFNKKHSEYEAKKKDLEAKQKALADAQAAKSKIEEDIKKIEAAIVKATTEKNKISKKLPNLKKQLKNIQNRVKVAQTAADATQKELNQINNKIKKAKDKVAALQKTCQETPSAQCTADLQKAQQDLVKAQKPKAEAVKLNNIAQNDLKKKKEDEAAKVKEISDSEKKMAALDKQNIDNANKLTAQKNSLKQAGQKVSQAQNKLKPVQAAYTTVFKQRNLLAQEVNKKKEQAITRIKLLNKMGSKVGGDSGAVDGDFYAEYIGVPQGQRDGDRDGRESGTTAGQNASYQQGVAKGEVEGRSQAQIDGYNDGEAQGVRQGLIDSATSQGVADGTVRADNSDAANVGTQQGRTAGLERAVKVGKKEGEAKGQAQAIEKNENEANGSQSVEGQFAGAFAARTPDYPGFNCVVRGSRRYNRDDYDWRRYNDWRGDSKLCPNFLPLQDSNIRGNKREIFKQAFMDGYLISYRSSRRQQFVKNIDHYYNSNYRASRDAAFSDYSTRIYPSYVESGRKTGYKAAYDSTYPAVRDRFYNDFYEATVAAPDTSASLYISTYNQVEGNRYAERYEEIRSNNFGREEQSTFDANISEQTEKFRKQRYATVDALYANNAVLKFVSSEIVDGGISGIAKNDGIFQPGETVFHNVTVKNFGKKAATNATVKVDGVSFKLPSIAAASTVTMKGVAKSSVDAKLGQTNESTLQVFSPVSAEVAIQGRHYYATSTGRLNYGDKKKSKVQFPINLAGLRTKSELLINKKNGLQMNVSNISKRAYTGPLSIELNVDAKTDIIVSDFSDINKLSGSVTLDSAQVLVASEQDVYSPLTFTAKIKKSGVTLGVLTGSYQTMAKAPYSDKAGAPVILTNSDRTANDLMKVVSSYGGLTKVSVLDSSLKSLNASVFNKGLDKKSVIVLDDSRGSSISALNEVLEKLEDSSVVFVDQSGRGLKTALNSSSKLKHAAKLPNLVDGFTNPVDLYYTNNFIDGTADMNVIAQANFSDLQKKVTALANFNFTKNEMLAMAPKQLNKKNYMTTNSVIRTLISMAAGEVVNASKAYKASGENESMVKFIEGNDAIYKRVLDAAPKKTKDKTLGNTLAAVSMWKVLDKAVDSFDPMDDNVDYDIESPFENAMKDKMQGSGLRIFTKGTWNYLKSYSKSLYNTIDDNPYVHSPFKL